MTERPRFYKIDGNLYRSESDLEGEAMDEIYFSLLIGGAGRNSVVGLKIDKPKAIFSGDAEVKKRIEKELQTRGFNKSS